MKHVLNRLTQRLLLVAPVLLVGSVLMGCPAIPDPSNLSGNAIVTFKNNSGRDYKIILDQTNLGIIHATGSKTRELAPDVQHTVDFVVASSGVVACHGEPVFTKGEHVTLSCSN